MPCPRLLVVNACCCTSLRTASIICGALLLVLYFNAAVVSAMRVQIDAAMKSSKFQDAGAVSGYIAAYASPLLFYLVLFAVTIILLVGLHKRRRGYLRAFLICVGIVIVLDLITIVLCFVYWIDARFIFFPPMAVLCARLVLLVISFVCIFFIRSYYYKMAEEELNIT